ELTLMTYRHLFSLAVVLGIAPAALAAQGAFGSALAVSGREVYVGQPGNVYGPGAVYVFRVDAKGVWRAATKITRSGATNGDGFRNNAGSWAAETTLTAGDTVSNPTFGNAVAASGSRLLVGGFRADSGNGAVYAFSRDASGVWKLDTKISPPGPITGRNSGFGSSLILRGDSAFIGALNDRGAGAVWLFARDSTSGRWGPVTRTLPFDGGFGTRYGVSLAEVGNELWIGADGANSFKGRVFRVTRDSTGFPSAVKLGPPPEQATGNDQFGAKIAATASLIAISASNEDYGEGGVTLYSRRASGAWAVAGPLVGDVSTLPARTGANRERTGGRASIYDFKQVDLISLLRV